MGVPDMVSDVKERERAKDPASSEVHKPWISVMSPGKRKI